MTALLAACSGWDDGEAFTASARSPFGTATQALELAFDGPDAAQVGAFIDAALPPETAAALREAAEEVKESGPPGRKRVIVVPAPPPALSLSTPQRGSGGGTGRPQTLAERASASAQARALFDDRAKQRGWDVVSRFDLLSLAVLSVTEAELDELVGSGAISQLVEDTVVPPSLAESGPLVSAPTAHSLGARGAGQTIAVLDTGVDTTHPFLTGRIVEEACFSSTFADYGATSLCPGEAASSTAAGAGSACTVAGCEHGTHVAGAAVGRAATGGASGMAPDASLLPIQVFSRFEDGGINTFCADAGKASPCALSFLSDQLHALEHVLERAAALNVAAVNVSSASSTPSPGACDNDPRKKVVDDLWAAGVASVFASGNNGFFNSVGAPACITTAVTVGSVGGTTGADVVSNFSNSNQLVDLLAPGYQIRSSVPGGGYAEMSGTSMAAPHVAGAFAALRSAVPTATPAEILGALQQTGARVVDSRNSMAFSRINIAAALAQLMPTAYPITAGTLFELESNGEVWAHDGTSTCGATSCPGWVMLDNNPTAKQVASAGTSLFELRSDGVWRYDGRKCVDTSCPAWTQLDNATNTNVIAAGGANLYQLRADGRVLKYTGTPCASGACAGWTLIDNAPSTQAIVADGNSLYQLRRDAAGRQVLRFNGTACVGSVCGGWTQLDNNGTTSVLAAAGGTLFQLRSDGRLLRSTGAGCVGTTCSGWTLLNNDAGAVQLAAASGTVIYQLNRDGSIWRSRNTPCVGNTCLPWTQYESRRSDADTNRTLEIVASSRGLFQRRASGEVLRSTGIACTTASSCLGWARLDQNATLRNIVAGQP